MLSHGFNLCRLIAFGHWASCALGHVLMTRAQGRDMLFAQLRRCALCALAGLSSSPSLRVSPRPVSHIPLIPLRPASSVCPVRASIACSVLCAVPHCAARVARAVPHLPVSAACFVVRPAGAACRVSPLRVPRAARPSLLAGALLRHCPCARSLWNCGPQPLFYTGSAGFLL